MNVAVKIIALSIFVLAPYIYADEVVNGGQQDYYPSPPAPPITTTLQDSGRNPPSHLGFYKADDQGIPAAVKNAANSVVLVVAPAGQPTTVEAIFGHHPIQDIIDRVEKTPLSDQLSQGDKDIYLYQLRACAETKDPMNCQMYEGDTISSGYLVADGSRIRTAFHAVRDWSERHMAQISGLTASIPVPVFIYDSSGKLISSPVADKPTAVFSKSNIASVGNTGQFTAPNDDLVEIQLNQSIGKPLQAASAPPKVGDQIYIIGYPQHSEDRKQFGAPDAPGGQLRISNGNVIPMDVFARKEGLDPNQLTENTKSLLRQMITTNADGAPGVSGGATVTATGQVIGTYTAGYPADGSATTNHISYSSTK